jgi:hypothetical protein
MTLKEYREWLELEIKECQIPTAMWVGIPNAIAKTAYGRGVEAGFKLCLELEKLKEVDGV